MVGLRKVKLQPISQSIKNTISFFYKKILAGFTLIGNRPQKGLLLLAILSVFFCSKPNGSFQELMTEGERLLGEGNKKEAYKYFESAIKLDDTSSFAHYAASKASPDNNSAYRHISLAWDMGLRSRGVLYDYLAYSFFTSIEKKKEFAFSLFEQMPENMATAELKGELLYFLGDYDSALTVWKGDFETRKSIELAKKIASVYAAQGLVDSVKALLLSPEVSNNLDVRSQIMLASVFAAHNEYEKVDSIFRQIRNTNQYKPPLILEDLTFTFLSGKHDEILKKYKSINSLNEFGSLKDDFLLLIATNAVFAGKIGFLNEFVNLEDHDSLSRINEFVKFLYKNEITQSINSLELYRKGKKNSVKDMTLAYLLASQNEDSLAIKKINALPVLYRESFSMLPLFANLIAKSGNDSLALSLVRKLHSKNYKTQNTLKLERDIYISKKQFAKAKKVHEELLERYPNRGADPALARIYSLQNRSDMANKEYLSIIKNYPDNCEIRKEFAKELFNRNEFKRCDLVLRKGPCASDVSALSIRAEALLKFNKREDAYTLFENAYEKNRNNLGFIEAYSLFLYKNKDYKKALHVYRHVSKDKFAKITNRGNDFSFIFINNYVWRKVAAGMVPDSSELNWIGSIYNKSGKRSVFRSTYGTSLRAAEKYAECLLLYKDVDVDVLMNEEIFILADCRYRLGYFNDAYDLFSRINGKKVECLDMDKSSTAEYIVSKISESDLKRRKNVN